MATKNRTSSKRKAGSRPGGRLSHWKVRCSPEEKNILDRFAEDNGKTVSLVIREALIAYGALPVDTPIIDRRTEAALNRRLKRD